MKRKIIHILRNNVTSMIKMCMPKRIIFIDRNWVRERHKKKGITDNDKKKHIYIYTHTHTHTHTQFSLLGPND